MLGKFACFCRLHIFQKKKKKKNLLVISSECQLYMLYDDELYMLVCLFVFVALRPMSTAMVIAGRSVHLTTLFPGQA